MCYQPLKKLLLYSVKNCIYWQSISNTQRHHPLLSVTFYDLDSDRKMKNTFLHLRKTCRVANTTFYRKRGRIVLWQYRALSEIGHRNSSGYTRNVPGNILRRVIMPVALPGIEPGVTKANKDTDSLLDCPYWYTDVTPKKIFSLMKVMVILLYCQWYTHTQTYYNIINAQQTWVSYSWKV